jgi:hypothetical protein
MLEASWLECAILHPTWFAGVGTVARKKNEKVNRKGWSFLEKVWLHLLRKLSNHLVNTPVKT